MTDLQTLGVLLIAFILGATPQTEMGAIGVAWLGKKLGVKPEIIEKYQESVDHDNFFNWKLKEPLSS